MIGPNGQPTLDANGNTVTTHNINPPYLVVLGGLTAALGAFGYGVYLYRSNEHHLADSVNSYNAARPNTPIGIEFSTSWFF